MTADEIRALSLTVTCDVATDQVAPIVSDCAYLLREIAAQLYEIKEVLKTRQGKTTGPRKPRVVASSARHSSNTARYFVHRWNSAVDANMLPEFTPKNGCPTLEQLAINQDTEGLLGTDANAKITRIQ